MWHNIRAGPVPTNNIVCGGNLTRFFGNMLLPAVLNYDACAVIAGLNNMAGGTCTVLKNSIDVVVAVLG